MAEIPPRQVQRRVDDDVADTGTRGTAGRVEPPRPQYAGLFVAPPDLPPADTE